MDKRHAFTCRVVLAAILGIPASAWAQGSVPAPVPSSFKLPPGVSVSFGAGSLSVGMPGNTRSSSPIFGGSLDIALNRYFVAQAEVLGGSNETSYVLQGWTFSLPGGVRGYTGDTTHHDHQKRFDVIGNVLARFGSGRLFATAGTGVGFSTISHRMESVTTGCAPVTSSICNNPFSSPNHDWVSQDFLWQIVGGVDVRLTKRLTAFGSFRVRTDLSETEDRGMFDQRMFVAGLRTTLRQAPISSGWRASGSRNSLTSAIGHKVHVVAHDNTRRNGYLESVDGGSIVLRQYHSTVTIPLREVKGVRRTSNAILKGTLIGLGAGFATGVLLCKGVDDCSAGWAGAMFGAIGTGAGLGVGTAINLASAQGRTVYLAPGSSSGLTLTPIVSKDRLGAMATATWK